MSYLIKTEYEIVPKNSFTVIRNCSGCGRKTSFQNTGKFRVNANGNKLDIWLIYQCENCRHTYNLTIYERTKATSVPKQEYKRFLDNDELLAETYGKNLQFFKKNKAEVNFQDAAYQFIKLREISGQNACGQPVLLTIHNPCCLKIRPEKQIAEVLGLSASRVKRLIELEEIKPEIFSKQIISSYINPSIFKEGNIE